MRRASHSTRRSPSWAKNLLFAALLFTVAGCSGGGCSSGCASCGTTPLPGGFPKNETIPNAAQARVTRSGLDFVQDNLGAIAQKALGAGAGGQGGVATFTIPKSSQSGAEICTPQNPVPPQCQAEIDLGNAKLRVNAVTPNRVKIDGLLPVRIRDLPVSLLGASAYVVAGDSAAVPNLCAPALRGAASFPYKEFPLNVELPLVSETRPPRDGYTKLDVQNAIIDIAITQDDVEICCSGLCGLLADLVKSLAFNALIGGIKDQIKSALTDAFCTAPTPTVTPPCPTGSVPNDADLTKADKCVFAGTDECVPALLGADGRMDLSQALAGFSPGSQGGLDFVLASAGEMKPLPSEAGVPAWTPRKPPVPAADNNGNGISLGLLGGALPQPDSKCVTPVDRPPPQGIPVPVEITGEKVTPWPAGTPGPHLGVAIAGRFLDHALLGAYNSGALCLGISTEQVDQLSSGILSLLVPSIKNLTVEQQSAAAAIATRPGVPPVVKIGGGTDVKVDPLLSIFMERLAVDFYVFSHDRFVRVLTYTADVTVPVNLQTGKDPQTNPNGGLLPVLGDLTVANGVVSSSELLLFEDPAVIAGGVTGLLGGLVGQFLGGGINPIDLQSALSSVGLELDIPTGGIRKLTSGSDDFLAIFANLKVPAGTALEQADTRAEIVDEIVDPSAMGLADAERARFPKLRVRVEGIASRPTEHTWWIDRGPHAAWTTAREIVVDQDAMLLQGKHVLYVASRVVGEMTSEDDTPVALPFVVDTLAPRVTAERDGGRVVVDAWDFVSPRAALLVRHRSEGGELSPWAPLGDGAFAADPSRAIDVEVKDEEGNVGTVRLGLRGRADSTLSASGSGCGCRATGQATGRSSGAGAALAALALAAALARRSRRRS